ncbi:two-component system histidine kinase PnpS [Bhargavaea massiliensis]|uniref:two-component system histidine kinase PnpS n=1 Tax=Bhargavaea massiliensis TaxID=2697500 RepID=UPI001BD07071|nr:ATP-binding protein [Bhargavaea massiliensis]
MKSLQRRLFLAFILIMGITLAGLAIVLGQTYPVLQNQGKKAKPEAVALHLDDMGIKLDSEAREELSRKMADDGSGVAPARFLRLIVIAFTVAFIVTVIVFHRLTERYIRPIDLVTDTTMELAKGNYTARAGWTAPGIQIGLVTAVNALARNLQEMESMRETEAERLETLIANMGSGLLMIGRNSEISMANSFFLDQVGQAEDGLIGSPYKAARLPEALVTLIDTVSVREKPVTEQIDIRTDSGNRTMAVYSAPVIDKHGGWLGIVVVMHDISELIRLERVRKDFVANVSHELRTPITSIRGFSETLMDGAVHDEEAAMQFLEIIHGESVRLETLIEDLLDLSKIEKEGYTLRLQSVSVQNVIDRSIRSVSGRINNRKMTIESHCPPGLTVKGDPERLVQILVNLLANAVSYSKPGTPIRVTATVSDGMASIAVADRGIGIPAAELPRLFERFYRVDRARSRDSGGTGLGLSIVKHLVDLHGGTISVESEPGKGSTFMVNIPLSHN